MQLSSAQPASSPYSGDDRAAERRDPRTEYALCRLAAVLLEIARNHRPSEAVSVTAVRPATVSEAESDAEAAADETTWAGELRSGKEEAPRESTG
jgi:hypothetical protein